MAKARKEGAKPAAKRAEKPGVDHARNLEAAIDFYKAEYPDEFSDERNYPFVGHLETVIARLQQK